MTDPGDILKHLEMLRDEVRKVRLEQQGQITADVLNARLAAIVESSDDAIISKSLDGIISTWNQGATRIFGYTAEEAIGKPILMLLPRERVHEEAEILSRLRRGERVDHFSTVRVAKDGRLVDVSLTISPIRDSMGRIVGASKIARDITQQRRAEEAIRKAKEEAERANAAKDQFLAILSHELRTPLTPVLAGLSLLEREKLPPEELKREIVTMRRHLELETQLIEDLLDHTRISRGKLQLKRQLSDLHDLVRAVVTMCEPEWSAKELAVNVLLEAPAHYVPVDARRMQQVLWNLLKNAIKFTPKGGAITMRTSSAGGTLRVEVTDSGIGISAELLERIFEPFEQGTQMIARRFGGLGLGLSISKSFVELHDGVLAAASGGRGKGATFSVALPGATTTAPAPVVEVPKDGAPRRAGSRVLVVDDHVDTRRLLSRLLSDHGHRVTTAGSVADALRLLNTAEFDVLISDIGLPDGSGLEIMAQARRHPHIRGIAVSGFSSEEDDRLSRDAGFSLHMSKPFDVDKLEGAIRQLTNGSEAAGAVGVAGEQVAQG